MKKAVFFIITILLTVGIWLGSVYSEDKGVKTNSSESAGQGNKAATPDQKAKQINLEEAKKIVAAKVNGVDIKLDAVIVLANRLQLKMTHAHSSEEPSVAQIQRTALERLIEQELAYQKAKTLGIVPEQKAVDAALADIRTKAGGEEEYKKLLERQAMTQEQLRTQIEKNLILETIYKQEALDKISVSEERIKKEYEENRTYFTQPEKISVLDVAISPSSSDNGAETVAREILNNIRKNDNDPNKLIQDGTFVVRDYELKKDNDGNKWLYEAAKKLKPGEISDVIKADDGLHIIKLVEHKPEKLHTFAEVRGFIESKLRTDEQNQKTREWFDRLKKNAKIEIFVHEAQRSAGQAPK